MTDAEPCIAVVDDEAPVRVAISRLLRLADYGVATFGSGEEFLASLETRRPACVILDVHMPTLSGFDVQSRLRAARVQVPVVFITASDDAALGDTALGLGGVALLRKPFSNDQLLEAVDVALHCDPNGAS
jgi:FixJ family two-component response regulator